VIPPRYERERERQGWRQPSGVCARASAPQPAAGQRPLPGHGARRVAVVAWQRGDGSVVAAAMVDAQPTRARGVQLGPRRTSSALRCGSPAAWMGSTRHPPRSPRVWLWVCAREERARAPRLLGRARSLPGDSMGESGGARGRCPLKDSVSGRNCRTRRVCRCSPTWRSRIESARWSSRDADEQHEQHLHHRGAATLTECHAASAARLALVARTASWRLTTHNVHVHNHTARS